MTAIETWIYQEEEVRTLLIDGEPCFIANDLCDVLGLANPRTSLGLIDDDEKGVHTMDTLGGAQQMAYVTEAGMYSLVLRSRKPEAKAFKRWLTHEVLPAIRKTGQYQRPMSLAERTMALMGELQAQVDEQARQLEAARPKIEYVETFVADEDLLTLRTIASDLKVGEQELRALLISKSGSTSKPPPAGPRKLRSSSPCTATAPWPTRSSTSKPSSPTTHHASRAKSCTPSRSPPPAQQPSPACWPA